MLTFLTLKTRDKIHWQHSIYEYIPNKKKKKVKDSRQLNKEIVEYSDSHVCADTFWWITNDKLAIAHQKCDGL